MKTKYGERFPTPVCHLLNDKHLGTDCRETWIFAGVASEVCHLIDDKRVAGFSVYLEVGGAGASDGMA
jgi:hypothetical protein